MRLVLIISLLLTNLCLATESQAPAETQTPNQTPAEIPAIPEVDAATDEQLQGVDGVPFAPPQSRSSNVDVGQGQNKCRTFTGSSGANPGFIDVTTLYSAPSYDQFHRLTEHATINLSNTEIAPAGSILSHDTIVKLRCKGVTMAMFQEKPSHAPVPVKEYFARCNNGYFYACKFDENMHDRAMDKYYVKYSGEGKKCLTSSKTPVFPCRQGCDITRFIDSNKYEISQQRFEIKDPIGYNFQGEIIEIIYTQILPANNVTVTCKNGTFLATSSTGQDKTFEVSCNTNGVVTFPDDTDMTKNSTCTDKKACPIPNDTSQQTWGVYRGGIFVRPANNIPHNGYIMVKCGEEIRKDERSALCVNGNYFPSAANVCKGNLYIEEGSDA